MLPRDVVDRVREATDVVALVGETVELHAAGKESRGLCPFHEDHHPSLCVNLTKQRWFCNPCGKQGDVIAWLMQNDGMSFPTAVRTLAARVGIVIEDKRAHQTRTKAGVTVAAFARAKGFDPDLLDALGITDTIHRGQPAIRFPYLDENLVERTANLRIRLERGAGKDDRFYREPGKPTFPYDVWLVATSGARERGRIVLVEGESDFITLHHHNIPTIAAPGNCWSEDWSHYLDGIPRVMVAVEPGQSGEGFIRSLSKSSLWPRCYLMDFNALNQQVVAS